ncbi:MAG: SusD/RagB family nutrient-binding outer membrane lipoprotein [Bacteroidota bacterium]|nr:SusD/RagB family nutrient-binding outer membrane lipoprotein [Bacteroidota bacterium]
MKKINNSFIFILILVFTTLVSCKDLTELNINPNDIAPEVADLNLLLPTVITGIGQTVVGLGFGDIAGVMQHTQKDGWSDGHNSYEWTNLSQSWSGYYGILRNADEYYNKAVAGGYEFHQGVGLILKAYTFGLITDLWGDAPYTDALKAEQGSEFFKPAFDAQQDIYHGIINDLDTANLLLSKNVAEYKNINSTQDVLYNGDVAKWRKLANSLALRYYMRLSLKEPSYAKEGIRKITSDSNKYPLITSSNDDANVGYIGSASGDSWPTNTVYDISPSGSYMRLKLCSTLVETLQDLKDPRLAVWANKIETPYVLVSGTNIDRVVNGKREISQDVADAYLAANGVSIDFDQEYVGIPPGCRIAQIYNKKPDAGQGTYNPHVSQLNNIYKATKGNLLQMRLMSASEINFILAEAALYGWAPGTPEEHYANGIKESFKIWGVDNSFNNYMMGAPYSGLESIMTQKWIASWSAAAEAWFDWRRTGLPELKAGEVAKREKLPLRFYYHLTSEIEKNRENAEAAIGKLEATQYLGDETSKNSAWSKMWLLQGTGKPY